MEVLQLLLHTADVPRQDRFSNLAILAVLALGLAGVRCTNGEGVAPEGRERRESRDEAIPVEVARLARGPIESVLRFSSNLEAETQVQLFSQAPRLVRELLVSQGDAVRKGQLLLRLQDDEQGSAVSKMRSQLDQARRESERRKQLYDQDLMSREQLTQAVREQEQLEMALQDSERELGSTELRAPISGTVTARLVEVGDRVQNGQRLLDIVDLDSIVAQILVPERNLGGIALGLPARIAAAATEGLEFTGRVDRISPAVDPQTGTVRVTVAIERQPGVRPGLYVDVDLITATHPDALLVPKRALVYEADQMFVYRLRDDLRVERVFIVPLGADKDHVEPGAGLAAGDRVVVVGQAGLKDGARVSLQDAAAAKGGSAG